MKQKTKDILIRKFWPFAAIYFLLINKNSVLHVTGWLESLKKGHPCRSDGTEIPWMNYQIIKVLENKLNKDLTLFEYGSGFSTKFYAKLVHKVVSVEYDKDWLSVIKNNLPDNSKVLYIEKDVDGDYCRAIKNQNEKFDVVVVDGRDRVNCVKQSIDCLTDRGVIILDDSQRENYQYALEITKKSGFRSLDFEGLKPTGFGNDRTTIFYRDNNCLDI